MIRARVDQFGVAAIMAVSVLGYFGGLQPVLASQAKRVIVERSIQAQSQELQELELSRQQLEDRVAGLAEQAQGYRKGFTASTRVNERIGELAELCRVSGVEVASITPGGSIEEEGSIVRPIAISGTGSPEAIARLLSQLRAVFPDMGARGFSIGNRTGSDASVSMSLVWFSGRADSAGAAD